ncbi:hypothetical protein Naga_100037g15 [Nannochloropsis gaditana]|uniref:Uncharacterized protein n=1 Tax=Nannochloropsis gaditana TaxID=72520 RepID=W7TZ11_9STRA|nr:hypothetical protein Naga_100037g15 [Nannochloropsis gaditana]
MCIPFFQAKILVPFNGVLNRADSNQGYFRAKCGYSERDIHRLHNMQALSSPRKKQGRFRPVGDLAQHCILLLAYGRIKSYKSNLVERGILAKHVSKIATEKLRMNGPAIHFRETFRQASIAGLHCENHVVVQAQILKVASLYTYWRAMKQIGPQELFFACFATAPFATVHLLSVHQPL